MPNRRHCFLAELSGSQEGRPRGRATASRPPGAGTQVPLTRSTSSWSFGRPATACPRPFGEPRTGAVEQTWWRVHHPKTSVTPRTSTRKAQSGFDHQSPGRRGHGSTCHLDGGATTHLGVPAWLDTAQVCRGLQAASARLEVLGLFATCVENRAVLAEVAVRRGDLHTARWHRDAANWRLRARIEPVGAHIWRAEGLLARAHVLTDSFTMAGGQLRGWAPFVDGRLVGAGGHHMCRARASRRGRPLLGAAENLPPQSDESSPLSEST